jgi:hypothetical protein
VAREPRLYRRDLAIGQKRHNLTSFKVAYNRSVAMVAPESPIVDANHGQRLGSWKGSTPHYARHGIIADRQHQPPGEVCRRPAAQRQAKMMNHAIEPPCPARTLGEHGFVEAFGENLSLAMRGPAAKAPCHDAKANTPP